VFGLVAVIKEAEVIERILSMTFCRLVITPHTFLICFRIRFRVGCDDF
jgi:hypothetical protein